jgi:hypothetical protein
LIPARVGTDRNGRPRVWRFVERSARSRPVPRGGGVAALVGAGALAVFEQLRMAMLGATLANWDTTMLWVAARDWLHGQIHQPNYWGQSYGSTLEAIPIGLAHLVGVTYWTSTTLTFSVIELLGWACLAWAAWRRGHRVVAGLALAMPVLLSAYHLAFVGWVPDSPFPRLFVIAGCSLLIADPMRTKFLLFGVLLIGLGAQFDPSTALLAGPVLAWCAFETPKTRAHLVAAAVAVGIALASFAAITAVNRRHHDYTFHDPPTLRLSAKTLSASGSHLDRFFRLYAPELVRSWWIPVGVFAALIGVLVVSRQLRYAVPAVTAGVLVLYGLSTRKALSGLGPLFPPGRIFLVFPATVWFLVLLATERTRPTTRRAVLGTRLAVIGLCIATVGSTALRGVQYGSREEAWRTRAIELYRANYYGFTTRSNVTGRCAFDARQSALHRARLVAYLDQTAAYACAALNPAIRTLFPRYERRTWLMYAELSTSRSRLVVSGVPARFCDLARQRASCSWTGGDAALSFPSQGALGLLASSGMQVRAFGPNCRAGDSPIVFGVVCVRGHGVDLTRRPFGPPPPLPDHARSEVVQAFSGMFMTGGNDRTFPNVELGSSLSPNAGLLRASQTAPAPIVEDVTFLDDHEAVVAFRLGSHRLTGEAVIQDGKWRVAAPTFCAYAPVVEYGVGCDLDPFLR